MLADQPYLSIPETARTFDVSETSVRRWVKTGRLKAFLLPSGRARIRREDIEAVLASDAAEVGAA